MKKYNSIEMAIKAIIWLKMNKSCYLHCTEFGARWRADAIGTNGTDIFEVEVKTSWVDFKADFTNKIQKHETLANPDKKVSRYNYKPNYLWFLVPERLKDQAVRFIKEEGSKNYGILYLDKNGEIVSAKSVKRLHSDKITELTKKNMISRMSNEYIYLIEQLKVELRSKVSCFFDQLLVDASNRAKEVCKND